MRPCRQCRTPIENQVAVCPHCGVAQAEGSRANPEPASPRRGILNRLLRDLADLLWFSPWLALLLLTLPLAVGGAVGYLASGETGAVIGAVAALVLVVVLAAVVDSGADGT